ncbi:MAG: hypothetical protein WAO52_03800, partial [Prolixibacteraceae bacterium]
MKTIDFKKLWANELRSLFGAIFIAVVATSLQILASGIFGLLIPVGAKASQIIAYLVYILVITPACYFLCFKNPSSIWFVPLICNATGIVSAIIEPGFWTSPVWIIVVFGWAVSLSASIWGHDAGIKTEGLQKS